MRLISIAAAGAAALAIAGCGSTAVKTTTSQDPAPVKTFELPAGYARTPFTIATGDTPLNAAADLRSDILESGDSLVNVVCSPNSGSPLAGWDLIGCVGVSVNGSTIEVTYIADTATGEVAADVSTAAEQQP